MMDMMESSVTPSPDEGTVGNLAVASLSLALRFAAGATMWCVAPQWPSHGRHVAVEFVHPVIVGKRALPAVSVAGDDAAAVVRLAARPGDVLLVLSTADDPCAVDLLARAGAWGLTSLWIGAGPRPGAGPADHVVWLEETDPALSSRSGDLVLLYHLLWELTHVVFEHPGHLEVDPRSSEDVCVTCSDEGRVAEVSAVRADRRVEVITEGRRETIDVSLVDPVGPGDLLLVHAGVAIASLGGARS